MKLTEISFKPIAHVAVSREEIDLLCECSAGHYDGVCKDASRSGGFLFGMRNYSEHAPEALHSLTWREIDTLAKIVEAGQYFAEGKAKIAFGLGLEMRRILIALNDAMPETVMCDKCENPAGAEADAR